MVCVLQGVLKLKAECLFLQYFTTFKSPDVVLLSFVVLGKFFSVPVFCDCFFYFYCILVKKYTLSQAGSFVRCKKHFHHSWLVAHFNMCSLLLYLTVKYSYARLLSLHVFFLNGLIFSFPSNNSRCLGKQTLSLIFLPRHKKKDFSSTKPVMAIIM